MLDSSSSPVGFIFQKFVSHFYIIGFLMSIDNASCIESIQVDSTLHVKLHHKECQIPLSQWFKSNQYLVKNITILGKLASHIRIFDAEKSNTILDEVHSIKYYKPICRKRYSSEVPRFSLLQRAHNTELMMVLSFATKLSFFHQQMSSSQVVLCKLKIMTLLFVPSLFYSLLFVPSLDTVCL